MVGCIRGPMSSLLSFDEHMGLCRWPRGVMVSTLDFESNDPSSSLGGTFLFFCSYPLMSANVVNIFCLAFAEGGSSFKMQTAFFWGGMGGVKMVIVWICSRDFSRHLGKAYTKYCPLSSPKRAECLRVCFHCLSGVVIVALNRSCRIRTYTPDAGDHGELF